MQLFSPTSRRITDMHIRKFKGKMKLTIRRILSKILNINTVSTLVLRSLKEDKIRDFYGDDFLSPIQAFAKRGYTESLYSGLNLTDKSQALILGGYKGDSTFTIYNKFNCNVLVYEPIDEYANEIFKQISPKSKIILERLAVSADDEGVVLHVGGESTSKFLQSGQIVNVKSRDISLIVQELEKVDLLEMNIEGGEYDVLKRLISAGDINKISTILVQFHNFELTSELERSKIRNSLTSTHDNIFTFDWVWERWDIKT
jgi:FkbM family methyltransferase